MAQTRTVLLSLLVLTISLYIQNGHGFPFGEYDMEKLLWNSLKRTLDNWPNAYSDFNASSLLPFKNEKCPSGGTLRINQENKYGGKIVAKCGDDTIKIEYDREGVDVKNIGKPMQIQKDAETLNVKSGDCVELEDAAVVEIRKAPEFIQIKNNGQYIQIKNYYADVDVDGVQVSYQNGNIVIENSWRTKKTRKSKH